MRFYDIDLSHFANMIILEIFFMTLNLLGTFELRCLIIYFERRHRRNIDTLVGALSQFVGKPTLRIWVKRMVVRSNVGGPRRGRPRRGGEGCGCF